MRAAKFFSIAIGCVTWTALFAATQPRGEAARHDAAVLTAQASPAAVRPPSCVASSAKQALSRADQLYEKGLYQQAGECYLAAGENNLADRAFLKAVGPAQSATNRQLSVERDQAKAQFRMLKAPFQHRR